MIDCVNRGRNIEQLSVEPIKKITLFSKLKSKIYFLYWKYRFKYRLKKIKFPLVKSIMPNLIVNDIVSVQPMTKPADSIFYLDFTKRERVMMPIINEKDKNVNN